MLEFTQSRIDTAEMTCGDAIAKPLEWRKAGRVYISLPLKHKNQITSTKVVSVSRVIFFP